MGTVIIRKKSFLLWGIIRGGSYKYGMADGSVFAVRLMKMALFFSFPAKNPPIFLFDSYEWCISKNGVLGLC